MIQHNVLIDGSKATLGEIELRGLNTAANLQKEMRALLSQLVEELADARVARWIREHKNELRHLAETGQEAFEFKEWLAP